MSLRGLFLSLCASSCFVVSGSAVRHSFFFFPFTISKPTRSSLWNPGDQCVLSLKLFLCNFIQNIPKVLVWFKVVIHDLSVSYKVINFCWSCSLLNQRLSYSCTFPKWIRCTFDESGNFLKLVFNSKLGLHITAANSFFGERWFDKTQSANTENESDLKMKQISHR